MTTTDRRSARNQPLPPDEASILASLRGFSLYARCAELFRAGWTLRAIGEAMEPPRTRSTIQTWVDKAQDTTPTVSLPPVASPELSTPKVYTPVRPPSPGIAPFEKARIESLAPIARKFRSGMSPDHTAAKANQDLTDLCKALHSINVSIAELADAAGVTYRAMAKRLGRS